MKVSILASTVLHNDTLDASPYDDQTDASGADTLAEFAGRLCYKSWRRPNPATATNEGYLANILRQGHYSVLEHVSVTFYVEGMSRALLTELERHRHLSFSVESQRYVDQAVSHPEPVIPLALRGTRHEPRLRANYADALDEYRETYAALRDEGLSKKKAREAARAFLPNATPVDLVVTGNLRAWRDTLGKRLDPSADAEIRMFAVHVLHHLREVAPNAVQDLTVPPTPEEVAAATARIVSRDADLLERLAASPVRPVPATPDKVEVTDGPVDGYPFGV